MFRSIGWEEILIVLLLLLVLFGGRLSKVAGDLAKGIKAFRKNLSDDDQDENKPDEDENKPE